MYEAWHHEGVNLGLITIPLDQQLPSEPKRTEDNGFTEGKIYFRRGSQNALASLQDQGQIWDWFRGRGIALPVDNPYVRERSWTEYLTEVEWFGQTPRHILVVDESLREDAENLSGLGSGPWAFVADFGPRSDIDGLLASSRATIEKHRALHIRTKGDSHTSRSPTLTTTWFFARGIEGRADSIPPNGIRGWGREYRAALRDEFNTLAGELSPASVYATILWRSPEFNEYLQEVLRTLDDSLHDSFRPIFVTDVPTACQPLSAEFDAPVFEMPVEEFTRGVQQAAEERTPEATGKIVLPSSSGVPVQLQPQISNWLAEEIELLPLAGC